MDNDRNSGPERIRPVEARQAVTGHHVFRVLAGGLVLAILAGVLLYFTVGV
jgi:hypothetical protein